MSERKFFRWRSGTKSAHAAHMTWASRSFSATFSRTRQFLSRRLWAWPIIAVTLLLALGWAVHGSIERTMKANLVSQMQTLLDVEVAMLHNWLAANENNAESMANDAHVRELTADLLAARTQQQSGDAVDMLALGREIATHLGPPMHSHNYDSYFIIDRELRIVATPYADMIGTSVTTARQLYCEPVLDGGTMVTPPFASRAPLPDGAGGMQTGLPVMYALAPIRDQNLQVIAILGLQIRPEREFTRILQLGQLGESGETYAFNPNGRMVSGSRFDHDLILLGLLPDQEDSQSILQLLVRDPGGDMTRGFRPQVRRSELPLTRMAAAAVAGEPGYDVEGYRDYRGVPVVGAWRWLDKYGFGVATEVDYAEAFRPLTILKRTFWGLLALLALSSVAIFVFTLMVARLQRQAREATIEAQQLGQYKLEEKLGEGAMGVVYRGRHAMLRRPTAIKLLNADRVTDTSINRFEREVQTTSHLNHPNTIAIYDYGHTPEGIFYYAMEYLDGIDLEQLVNAYGPQPEGRVIYILRQVCGSLFEAHSSGLVHRDIKPANVMINRRGGEGDVVKVLDFGLVKARDDKGSEREENSVAGTPLYMSPEAIQLPNSVDACSDLYAVGAVGYFLVTGKPVFEASSLAELCNMHTSQPPVVPSVRLGRPVAEDLEHALLACLEKDRAKRPQTARALSQMLDRCAASHKWSLDDADAWWAATNGGSPPRRQPTRPAVTTPRRSITSHSPKKSGR